MSYAKSHITRVCAGLLMCSTLGAISTASAQETKLRVGDGLPVGHYIAEGLIEFWMEGVNEKLGNSINFEYFPAEQLGKEGDMLSLTQTGVLDISYVGPSYVSDKMPLSAVAQLPGIFSSACEGTLAYWELAKPGGILYEAEFAPNKVRPLMVLALAPYQIFTSKRKIENLASFKGLKLRSTGGAMGQTILGLKAVPVQITGADTYDALSRGTLDGLVFPMSSLPPYHLETLLKYGTEGLNMGSFIATYVISDKTWESLTAKEKQVFEKLGEAATRNACKYVEELDEIDKAKVAKAGVSLVTLDDTELSNLNDITEKTADKWAEDLETRGRPGKKILEAYLNEVEKQ